MPDSSNRKREAIIIGGNMAGLTTAYVFGSLGYRTTLIERSPHLGGMDRSFTNRNGRRFDCGLHVLDFLRSEVTTHLLQKMVDGEVHKVRRRRGLVLRNAIFPYNSPVAEWPEELRRILPDDPIRDDLGSDPPTRENLARYYGRPFVDFIYDEVLASYPSETRHFDFDVAEHALLTNIYPWFFPHADRTRLDSNRSRRYHDRARERQDEYFLYPKQGGFGGFVDGFRNNLEALGVEVLCDVPDLELRLDDARERVVDIQAGGQNYEAPRVLWCAPVDVLCRILEIKVPSLKPDQFVLGSFEFSKPLRTEFNELIVGDPEHLINRGSFTGMILAEDRDLVQLEFSFPRATEPYPLDESFWRESWEKSLRRLGIAQPGNELVDFDLKCFPALYNCYGIEGSPLQEITFDHLPEDSNLIPVLPSIRNINISTRVPQFLEFVVREVSRERRRVPGTIRAVGTP